MILLPSDDRTIDGRVYSPFHLYGFFLLVVIGGQRRVLGSRRSRTSRIVFASGHRFFSPARARAAAVCRGREVVAVVTTSFARSSGTQRQEGSLLRVLPSRDGHGRFTTSQPTTTTIRFRYRRLTFLGVSSTASFHYRQGFPPSIPGGSSPPLTLRSNHHHAVHS